MTKLHHVALGCWNGACNPSGLIISLGDAMKETHMPLQPDDKQDLQLIIEHLAMLVGTPTGDLAQRYQPALAA